MESNPRFLQPLLYLASDLHILDSAIKPKVPDAGDSAGQHNRQKPECSNPTAVAITNASKRYPPDAYQNARVNVNVNCPATDKPGPTLVQTERLPTTPVDVGFMGARGMVEIDLTPLDQQSGSQPMLTDAAAPARLKTPQATEWIEQRASEKVTGKAEAV